SCCAQQSNAVERRPTAANIRPMSIQAHVEPWIASKRDDGRRHSFLGPPPTRGQRRLSVALCARHFAPRARILAAANRTPWYDDCLLNPRSIAMSVALKIVDQTLGVHPHVTRELRLASERITLRELIERRIEEEVAAINAGRSDVRPLVMPTRQEARLNGVRAVEAAQPVDPRKQLEAAITAFARTRIVVIVDGRQATDLDQQIAVTPQTEVGFIRLVPLVGGGTPAMGISQDLKAALLGSPAPGAGWAQQLVAAFETEVLSTPLEWRGGGGRLEQLDAGRRIVACVRADWVELVAVVFHRLKQLQEQERGRVMRSDRPADMQLWRRGWALKDLLTFLLRPRLPFTDEGLAAGVAFYAGPIATPRQPP